MSPYSGKLLSYKDLERDFSLGKQSLSRLFQGSQSKLESGPLKEVKKLKEQAARERARLANEQLAAAKEKPKPKFIILDKDELEEYRGKFCTRLSERPGSQGKQKKSK